MTKVSIISLGIKELEVLKNKLVERDAEVEIFNSLEELTNNGTSTLICHSDALNKSQDDAKNLLSLARSLKIKKIIQIESYTDTFSLKSELGKSFIRIDLIQDDKYSLEVLISHALDDEKFITGSKESLMLKALSKKVANLRIIAIKSMTYKVDGDPYGVRTRVTAVKGRRPRPLDEGDL